MKPEIDFFEQFFSPQDSTDYFEQLLQAIDWQQKTIKIFGKQVLEPRLTAWHGDSNAVYTYSGTAMIPKPWTPELMRIKEKIEKKCERQFNSVLLNLYRNHQDSMGFHSDDEKELGSQPLIASVSLGETRRFILRPKQGSQKPLTYQLRSGSLLIMRGNLQSKWKHGVPKENKPCGPRINLTFRQILSPGL